jgi:hypothetical protein
MVDHLSMELLEGATTLAPLEVQDRIAPVGHGLETGQTVHPRLLEPVDSLPVDLAGGAFHQKPGLAVLE